MTLNLTKITQIRQMKAQATKEKIDKLDFIKIKTCYASKDSELKDNTQNGENICKSCL